MAAITTAAAGAWSSTGTWTGGVIPGNGDTVTLNHAVTVADARTVGVSPVAGAATNAIRCNAALTIQNGGALTVRGDIGLNNVPLNMTAGGILEFDASQAGTPSTALYVCKGINATDPLAILTITGTSGNRCTVRSNSGGANGRFVDNGNDHSGQVDAQYCDFLRIGDATNRAFAFILGDGEIFSLQNCTLSACGRAGDQSGVGVGAQAIIRLVNVRMTSPADTNVLGISANARTGTGVRTITGSDLGGTVSLYNITGYTITTTIFRLGYDYTGGPWAQFYRNVISLPQADGGDLGVAGQAEECYFLRLGDPTNPHYFTTEENTTRVNGCVFDCPDGTNGAGDCITFNNPSVAKTVTVDHNLVLFGPGDVNAGTMLSCLGGANLTVIAEHNTYHGGQGIYVGEAYAGYAGMVQSVRSNLAYAQTAAAAWIMSSDPAVVQNVALAANVVNNGVWNPADADGYEDDLTWSPGAPGAGDVHGDPLFQDITRNIKTWDTYKGGPGTTANALDEIGLGNRTISDLLTWVKAGFIPYNFAYRAAHDSVPPSNGWIGAIENIGEPVPPYLNHNPRPRAFAPGLAR